MSAVPLRFATKRQEREWLSGQLDARLVSIVTRGAEVSLERFAWLWTVTSIWRTGAEDAKLKGSGLHTLWRAIDIRTNDAPAGALAVIGNGINNGWVYDPARPKLKVAVWKPHGTGPHLHLQVSSATVEEA